MNIARNSNHSKAKYRLWGNWRMFLLLLFIPLFVGIFVFAQTYNFDSDDGPHYVPVPNVYVIANENGSVNIWPANYDYEVYQHEGAIAFLFSYERDKETINITLPYGWEYSISGSQEIYNYVDWVTLLAYEPVLHAYQLRDITAVVITPPEGEYAWYTPYYGFILDGPYYIGNNQYEYGYGYNYDYSNYGFHYDDYGFAYEGGFIGIQPFANFVVTFNHNDNGFTNPLDFPIRSTLNNGTVGTANMPPDPVWPDRRFFAWSRNQEGSGGLWTSATVGYIFNGNSIVSAGQNPYTVYALWGMPISFNCKLETLPMEGTPFPSIAAQFWPRYVLPGRTFTQSNGLGWTITQTWPNRTNATTRLYDGNSYFFAGWYTLDGGGNFDQRVDINTVITDPIQVYARWERRQLMLNPRDGVTQPEDFGVQYMTGTAAGLAIGAANVPPAPVHPQGLHFMGWTRTYEGMGTATAASTRERVIGTTSFTVAQSNPGMIFAQWGYVVTFDGNGATLNKPVAPNPNLAANFCDRIVAVGRSLNWTRDRNWSSINLATAGANGQIWPNNPTLSGYVFGGWFTMVDNDYDMLVTADTPIHENKTLYARWIPLSEYDGRYVIFNPQNGTPASEFIEVPTLAAGNIGLANWPTPNPTRSGFHFMAWTRSQLGTGTATGATGGELFDHNSIVAAAVSPYTIHAQWGHQVSFDLNGGAGTAPAARVYKAGMSAAESNALVWTTAVVWPANPANTATMSFIGWYTRDGGEYGQRFTVDTQINSDVVLYARWSQRMIIFNPNDGETTPDYFEYRILTGTGNASVGAANMPPIPYHPEGLHFMAWARYQDGIGTTGAVVGTTTFTIADSPRTVYAQWGYIMTFDGGDHNLAATGFDPRLIIPGTSIFQTNNRAWTVNTTVPNHPTRRGFKFMGWYEVGATELFDFNAPVTQHVHLYARWESLRIYFDPNDGVTLPPGFAMREMMWNGLIGDANMPPNPPQLPDGRYFMAWTRPPSLYGSVGTFTGLFYPTQVTGATWFHPIESPLTATARYGWKVTFSCALTGTLPAGTGVNGFGPRMVYDSLSLAETAALSWATSGVVWPNPPTQLGYSFLGWYTMDYNGNYLHWYDAETAVFENLELHARWETRRVTFNPRDGVTTPQNFQYRLLSTAINGAIQGTMPPNPASPRYDGLHFIAWTRTEAGLGTLTATNNREHVIIGTTFPHTDPPPTMAFGQWGHRVQFNGNGVTAAYTERFVLPGTSFAQTNSRTWVTTTWPADPTSAGRTFIGWYTRNINGAYDQEFIFDPNMIWNGDLVLYARWDIATVIFNVQDGVTPSSSFETREVLPGGSVGATNMPVTPIRPGHRFMTWTRTSCGFAIPPVTHNTNAATGVEFTGASTITIDDSPVTAYAQWGHQVTFLPNGGSLGTNSSARVIRTGLANWENTSLFWTPTAAASTTWPTNPTRVNYNFVGWYTRDINGDYHIRVDNNTPITPALADAAGAGVALGNVTLYARWRPQEPMQVIFNPNDGSVSGFFVAQTSIIGYVTPVNFAPDPTWGDRIFQAWTRTQDGSGNITGVSAGTRFVPSISATNRSTITAAESPFTVYAQWAYEITFNGNGVTLAGGTTATGWGPRIILEDRNVAEHNYLVWTTNVTWPNNPTRAGHSFQGWYTRDAGGYDKFVDATTAITSNYALYARWEPTNVIFRTNGGLHVGESNPLVERLLPQGSIPPAPTKSGYFFINWTRTQCGNVLPPWTNNTAAATGILFNAASTVPPLMVPFPVYAQWGNRIDFNSGTPALNLPNPNSTTATGYGPRYVATGRTVSGHNYLAWATPNITWPNDPVRTDSAGPGLRWVFTGWAITHNNTLYGNFLGYFCPDTTVVDRQLILFARWEPETYYTVTFDMTDGTMAAGHTNTRNAWPRMSVSASSTGTVVANRLNTPPVLWPRSAPSVSRTAPVPMTVASWWTERYGPYGYGTFWSPAGWPSSSNVNTSTTGQSTAEANLGQGPANTVVNGDITVYPNWVFRVHFMPNGGSTVSNRFRDIPTRYCSQYGGYLSGTIRNQGRHPDNSINRNFPAAPTMSNHVFISWWSEPIPPSVPLGEEAAHGFPNAYEFTLDTLVTQNRNVYARWIPILPNPEITQEFIYVHFDLNTGGRWWPAVNSPLPPGGQYAVRTVRIPVGSTVGTARMPQFPIGNPGYIFMGWYNTPNGPSGTAVPPNPIALAGDRFLANVAVHETRTVYAHWEPYVILTVNPNQGNITAPQPSGVLGQNHHIMMAVNRNFSEMYTVWGNSGSTAVPANPNLARPDGHPSNTDFRTPNSTTNSGITARTTRTGFSRMPLLSFWGIGQSIGEPFFGNTTRVLVDTTIYARWGVVVTFNRNQTTTDTLTSQTALFSSDTTMRNSAISMPAATNNWSNDNLVRNIIGWSTHRDHTHPEAVIFSIDTVVTQNITVFAIWSEEWRIQFLPGHAPVGTVPLIHRERVVGYVGQLLSTTFSPEDNTLLGLPPAADMDAAWPGHRFLSWNLVIDGHGAGALTLLAPPAGDFSIPRIINIYAIWEADVIFNAQGGIMTPPAGAPAATPIIAPERITQTIADQMPVNLQRPGWHPARIGPGLTDFMWATTPFGLVNGDIGHGGNGFRGNTPIMQTQHVYAQWLIDVVFETEYTGVTGLLPGAYSIPETGTWANVFPTGSAPAAIPFPVKPGHAFTHWEVQIHDSITNQYEWVTFTEGTVMCDVITGRFARETRGGFPSVIVRPQFELIYIDDAYFYKTDMGIYVDDGEDVDFDYVEFLPGAIFHLYRYTWDEVANEWVLDVQVSNNLVSDANGRVALPTLTATSRYRLREVQAPLGFVTPSTGSYWILVFTRVSNEAYVVSGVNGYNGVLPFVRIPVQVSTPDPNGGYIYEYVYVWHVGNQDGEPFTFRKADDRVISQDNWPNAHHFLLQGAQFRLFRTVVATDDLPAPLHTGSPGLITLDPAGQAGSIWVEVPLVRDISSANFNEPIFTALTPGFTYQLVEIMAPVGFQIPMGQWRIEVCEINPTGFDITNIGSVPMPGFNYVPCNCLISCDVDNHWYLGNWRTMELPLSGGGGTTVFTTLGLSVIVAAGLLMVVFYMQKKNNEAAALKVVPRVQYRRR